MYLVYMKMMATAVAPFLFIVNVAVALWGWRRDRVTALFGLMGAFFSGRYIACITKPHEGLQQGLGPDWEANVPETLRAHFLTDPYTIPLLWPPEVPWARNVVIGRAGHTHDPLLADVWQPTAETPRSGLVVIYLHGSGWHYLDKDFGTRLFFRHLAQRGHVVIDVAYTMPPQTDLSGMVADVKRAIAWAKENADQYGFRPEGVVLMGGSAGGHLAMLAGFTPNDLAWQPVEVTGDTAVAGVVSYYGVSDLVRLHMDSQVSPLRLRKRPSLDAWMKRNRLLPAYGTFVNGNEMLVSLLGGPPEACPEAYRQGAPLTYVGAHCPPTLLLNGAHDIAVAVSHHRQVWEGLRAVGVTAVHHEIPYADHGFDLIFPRWAPAYQVALYDVERFLAYLAIKVGG